MKITVLSNNYTNCNIKSEHGLSLFVEFNGKKILIDAGLSDLFIRNAKILGIDLSKTDYVIISHGHYGFLLLCILEIIQMMNWIKL